MQKERRNILFVCKYNRFRSQVAENYFKKINKNKNIKVKSAGILQGRYPVDSQQKAVAKSLGVNIGKRPETIKSGELGKVDTIVIVANDVPKKIFTYNGKYLQKVIVWKIKDEVHRNKKNNTKIVKKIKKKVEKLVKDVGNN